MNTSDLLAAIARWRTEAELTSYAAAKTFSTETMRVYDTEAATKRTCADELEALLRANAEAWGEPVAWQVRHDFGGGRWSGWAQSQSESEARFQCARYAENDTPAEWRALYALQAAKQQGGEGEGNG